MKKNIYLLISTIIHVVLLILFVIQYKNFTVIHLLSFSFAPIALSLVIFSWCYLNEKCEKFGLFSSINIGYFICFAIILLITNADDVIYLNSTVYVSEYVEVSQSNSLIFSLVIVGVISYTMHIFARNILNSYLERKGDTNEKI